MPTPSKEYLMKLAAIQRGEVFEGDCQSRDCKNKGRERVDRGLLCGCWCDECFDKMVSECRSRSW